MKKIVLFCNAGLSTSALVKRMRDVAVRNNLDYEIHAYAVDTAMENGADADVILIGPQISYRADEVKKIFPEKPVEVIDMASYGMIDGKKVLIQARKLMKEH